MISREPVRRTRSRRSCMRTASPGYKTPSRSHVTGSSVARLPLRACVAREAAPRSGIAPLVRGVGLAGVQDVPPRRSRGARRAERGSKHRVVRSRERRSPSPCRSAVRRSATCARAPAATHTPAGGGFAAAGARRTCTTRRLLEWFAHWKPEYAPGTQRTCWQSRHGSAHLAAASSLVASDARLYFAASALGMQNAQHVPERARVASRRLRAGLRLRGLARA